MDLVERPPRTIMEVFKRLPEGTLAEIIDGNLYMLPFPNTSHQRALGDVVAVLHSFVDQHHLGEVFLGPLDVYLDEEKNVVQPNIFFVSSENDLTGKDDFIHGVPDLIIEILSPGFEEYDLVRKKELYEKFGVKEYWVINPDSKESSGFFLKDGKYDSPLTYQACIKSLLLNHEFHF